MVSRRLPIIKQFWPDFGVTEDDLRQPSVDFVMGFYERILRELSLYDVAMQHCPSDKVQDPLIIKDGLLKVVFCSFLRDILSVFKGLPFGIEDIIDPDPKRLGRPIDILLNLVSYLDVHCAEMIGEQLTQLDEQCHLKETLIKEIDEFTEKSNDITMEKSCCDSALKVAESEMAKYEALLEIFMENSREIQNEKDQYKGVLVKEEEREEALNKAIEKELEEINSLKEGIVKSPDAVYRERVVLLNKQKDLEGSYSSLDAVIMERTNFLSKLDQLCIAAETIPKKIKEVGGLEKMFNALEQGLQIDETNYQNAKNKLEAAMKNLHSVQQSKSKLFEEESNLKKEYSARCASLEKEIQRSKESKQEAEQEQIKRGAEQVVIAQDIHQWKDKINAIKKDEETLNKVFMMKKCKTEQTVQEFEDRLKAKIDQMKNQLKMPRNQPRGA